jgi:hypothetical protein
MLSLGRLCWLLFITFYTFIAHAAFECVDSPVQRQDPGLDILFLLDASHSMCPYIKGLRLALQTFASQLSKMNFDIKYSVVQFGGTPKVLSPFTVSPSSINIHSYPDSPTFLPSQAS